MWNTAYTGGCLLNIGICGCLCWMTCLRFVSSLFLDMFKILLCCTTDPRCSVLRPRCLSGSYDHVQIDKRQTLHENGRAHTFLLDAWLINEGHCHFHYPLLCRRRGLVCLVTGIQTPDPPRSHHSVLSLAGVHTRLPILPIRSLLPRLLWWIASTKHTTTQRPRTASTLQLQPHRFREIFFWAAPWLQKRWNDTFPSPASVMNSWHVISFCFPELSIQPQLNSILIPPHARTYTTASSHGETQLWTIYFRLLFSNNNDNNPFGCLLQFNWRLCFFFFIFQMVSDQIHLYTVQYQDLLTASEKKPPAHSPHLHLRHTHTHTYIHAFDNSLVVSRRLLKLVWSFCSGGWSSVNNLF